MQAQDIDRIIFECQDDVLDRTTYRNLTNRYPDGFKTGIEKYRLVLIGANWYRFGHGAQGLRVFRNRHGRKVNYMYKYAGLCRFAGNMSMGSV